MIEHRSSSPTSLKRAKNIVYGAKRIVIFSGAGISTESGIPDFRSKGGLWTRFDPDLYADFNVFLDRPELYWDLERAIQAMLAGAEPNAAHLACVELERQGRLLAVITQNIDMLHQRAGLITTPVYELHGSSMTASCVECGQKHDRDWILDLVARQEIPRCNYCGGLVKFDVVLFHERLPEQVLDNAIAATEISDCLIVIGSSLEVAPANVIPLYARRAGVPVVVINMDPTPFDPTFDVVLRGRAGELLPLLIG
jgi:NAD-dependent deacetylase